MSQIFGSSHGSHKAAVNVVARLSSFWRSGPAPSSPGELARLLCSELSHWETCFLLVISWKQPQVHLLRVVTVSTDSSQQGSETLSQSHLPGWNHVQRTTTVGMTSHPLSYVPSWDASHRWHPHSGRGWNKSDSLGLPWSVSAAVTKKAPLYGWTFRLRSESSERGGWSVPSMGLPRVPQHCQVPPEHWWVFLPHWHGILPALTGISGALAGIPWALVGIPQLPEVLAPWECPVECN